MPSSGVPKISRPKPTSCPTCGGKKEEKDEDKSTEDKNETAEGPEADHEHTVAACGKDVIKGASIGNRFGGPLGAVAGGTLALGTDNCQYGLFGAGPAGSTYTPAWTDPVTGDLHPGTLTPPGGTPGH